jgi:hypothetical protein
MLKNGAAGRDPALRGVCKCVLSPKLEGWEAGKLESWKALSKTFSAFF